MDNFEIAEKEIWADEELTVVVLLPEINVVDEIDVIDEIDAVDEILVVVKGVWDVGGWVGSVWSWCGSQQETKLVVTLLK